MSSEAVGTWAAEVAAMARGAAPDEAAGRIGAALSRLASDGHLTLPERLRTPPPSGYARRLLHRDPASGATVLVLAWPARTATPLHDHAGLWGVECLVEGSIEVESFELVGETPDGRCRLTSRGLARAGVGEVGAVVPPLEYHVLRNPGPGRAVTVHVYGGDLDHCHVFVPEGPSGGNLYRRERRLLSLSD